MVDKTLTAPANTGPGFTGQPARVTMIALLAAIRSRRIPQNRRRIARQRHVVCQRDDRAGRQAQRIMREPRRNAVRIVAVAPDLRRRLGRVADVGLVAVLPLVVINHRPVAGDDDGKGRGNRRAGAG